MSKTNQQKKCVFGDWVTVSIKECHEMGLHYLVPSDDLEDWAFLDQFAQNLYDYVLHVNPMIYETVRHIGDVTPDNWYGVFTHIGYDDRHQPFFYEWGGSSTYDEITEPFGTFLKRHDARFVDKLTYEAVVRGGGIPMYASEY